MPINPNLSTSKTDFASRPSVPASQKESASEWNLLVSAVKSNYERLILDWTTDVLANSTLAVGQYVLFDDGVAIAIYKITTSYNVGSPITWNGANAIVIISSSPNRFKGVYASEAALEAAFPTATPGDYALVDIGGTEAELYIWDDTDSDWVASGVTTVVPPWDNTTAGIVERSITAEAQNIVTRTAAGSSDSSNSDLRTPSEKGLVEMLLSFLAGAWTWAAKQTFTTAPRFDSGAASQFLKTDSSKDMHTVPASTQAKMLTGTDDNDPATAKSVEDKESDKLQTISNAATGSSAVNFGLKRRFKGRYNTTVTGNITVTFTDDTNLEFGNIIIPITGSVAIVWPSSVVMEEGNPRWTNGTKTLSVIGGTASPFVFSLDRIANTPLYELRASYRIHTS